MGASTSNVKRQAGELCQPATVHAHQLRDDGLIPNNPNLPLLIYEGALNLPEHAAAEAVEDLVRVNEWGGSWRNGIYDYHHYHSTAHEVLVVYCGSASVQLGGERGITAKIQRGDILIIPAGVAHKNIGASPDFKVLGAYPKGQDWNMCYGKASERPGADQEISRVPLPKADPVYGTGGPLMQHWGQH